MCKLGFLPAVSIMEVVWVCRKAC
uniref:Uncharacterized protein n=1 Tax=Arundo donax TaxID=35708 RepID=A0A0A9BL83_ARUDO